MLAVAGFVMRSAKKPDIEWLTVAIGGRVTN
jgi:hypothetical protein